MINAYTLRCTIVNCRKPKTEKNLLKEQEKTDYLQSSKNIVDLSMEIRRQLTLLEMLRENMK